MAIQVGDRVRLTHSIDCEGVDGDEDDDGPIAPWMITLNEGTEGVVTGVHRHFYHGGVVGYSVDFKEPEWDVPLDWDVDPEDIELCSG